MKKIKDIISKPSQALRAMVDGLYEQSTKDDFVIDMHTYLGTEDIGFERNGEEKIVCVGCAATCAVMKLTGTKFDPINVEYNPNVGALEEYMSKYYDFSFHDIRQFEQAVNAIRFNCDLSLLFAYFDISFFSVPYQFLRNTVDAKMDSDNWKEFCSLYVEPLILQLEAVGL